MAQTPTWKRDPRVLPAICDVLRGGGTRTDAARAVNLSFETLDAWCSDTRYPEVREKVEAAEAHARETGARPAKLDKPRAASAPEPKADRWDAIREEAGKLGPGLYGCLMWLESRIAMHNEKAPQWDRLPPMPAPLLAIFRDFWASGKQELLVRGGRGLGKSTQFTRPTIVECLFAPPVVNGGEIAIWPELSVDMDEANLKVPVLEKLLSIAGFRKATTASDEEEPWTYRTMRAERGRTRIKFKNSHQEQIEIRVYPATVKALSGPTLKGARHDEEAKWKTSSKDETNSAEDVIDAEAGAFRGRLHAHLFRVSSAWKAAGIHYRDVEGIDENGEKVGDGDTDTRHVARLGDFLGLMLDGLERVASAERNPVDAAEIRAYAATLTPRSPNLPSWINPSLDPLELRRRSRNVRVFLREYASKSSGAGEDGDYFDPLTIDAAESMPRPAGEPVTCYAAIDTGAKRNPAALAIVGRWDTATGARYAPVLLKSWKPQPGRPLDLRLVVLPEMMRTALANGCGEVWSDGFASDQIDLVAAYLGVRVRYVATSEAHRDVYGPVADGLARAEVCLAASCCAGTEDAAAQLRRVSSEVETGAAGAHVRILVPEDAGGEHGDLGVALVRALAAAGAGKVESAPSWVVGAVPGRYSGVDPRNAGRRLRA